MKIGLLLIATGKYDRFILPLLKSSKKHFFKNEEVHYFLFTDTKKWKESEYLHIIPKMHEPYPAPTLKRYETFINHKEELQKMDYLFYCDIDMLFVDDINEEILGDRVATLHPLYVNSRGTPETRMNSKAGIAPHEKMSYFAGGFNGGSSEAFLKMSEVLSNNIKEDLNNGIVAIWHDESHMNRYFIDNPPTKILSPSYCYPESWNLPYKKILLALDKNHAEVRS